MLTDMFAHSLYRNELTDEAAQALVVLLPLLTKLEVLECDSPCHRPLCRELTASNLSDRLRDNPKVSYEMLTAIGEVLPAGCKFNGSTETSETIVRLALATSASAVFTKSRAPVTPFCIVTITGHDAISYNATFTQVGEHQGIPRFASTPDGDGDSMHLFYLNNAWVLKSAFAPDTRSCKSWVQCPAGCLPVGVATWHNGDSSSALEWPTTMRLTVTMKEDPDDVTNVVLAESDEAKDAAIAEVEAFAAAQQPDKEYEVKLKGSGKVTVQLSPMGVMVTMKKGKPPTTYLYQTLNSWGIHDKGFEVTPSSGKQLVFDCGEREAEQIASGMTKHAMVLAKAQKEAKRAAKAEAATSEPEPEPEPL